VSARNLAVSNDSCTIDDETCAVLSRPELERLADLLAYKLAPRGEHSQGFMVYAVDEHGSDVVKIVIASPQKKS
jgi:hypothetical protein